LPPLNSVSVADGPDGRTTVVVVRPGALVLPAGLLVAVDDELFALEHDATPTIIALAATIVATRVQRTRSTRMEPPAVADTDATRPYSAMDIAVSAGQDPVARGSDLDVWMAKSKVIASRIERCSTRTETPRTSTCSW
jgi:hypothetical protein